MRTHSLIFPCSVTHTLHSHPKKWTTRSRGPVSLYYVWKRRTAKSEKDARLWTGFNAASEVNTIVRAFEHWDKYVSSLARDDRLAKTIYGCFVGQERWKQTRYSRRCRGASRSVPWNVLF